MTRIVLSLLTILLVLTLPHVANSAECEYGTVKKLWKSLERFSQHEKLSRSQLQDLLFTTIVDTPCLKKGGLGVIRDDIYIKVDDENNALLLKQAEWTGKVRTNSEAVLVSKHHILKDGELPSGNDLLVIVFSPAQVRFIDYKDKRAGTYQRLVKIAYRCAVTVTRSSAKRLIGSA